MDTPHHRTAPRRSSGHGVRSARCSIASSSSDPGSRLLQKPHATACAVLCGGHQELAHSLWGQGGVRIRAARQHGMRTSRPSAVAACSQSAPHPLPPRPLARRTLRHIPTETRAPWVSLHPAAAHAHAFSCTRPRWRESHTRSYGMLLLLWRTLWRTSLAAPQPLLPARILTRRQTCFEGAWCS